MSDAKERKPDTLYEMVGTDIADALGGLDALDTYQAWRAKNLPNHVVVVKLT